MNKFTLRPSSATLSVLKLETYATSIIWNMALWMIIVTLSASVQTRAALSLSPGLAHVVRS